MNWKTKIKKHFEAPLEKSFAQFRLGAMIFFIGLVIIYAGSISLEPSLTQEIIALIGLIVIAVGFIIAISAQIRMMLSRFLNLFKDD